MSFIASTPSISKLPAANTFSYKNGYITTLQIPEGKTEGTTLIKKQIKKYYLFHPSIMG